MSEKRKVPLLSPHFSESQIYLMGFKLSVSPSPTKHCIPPPPLAAELPPTVSLHNVDLHTAGSSRSATRSKASRSCTHSRSFTAVTTRKTAFAVAATTGRLCSQWRLQEWPRSQRRRDRCKPRSLRNHGGEEAIFMGGIGLEMGKEFVAFGLGLCTRKLLLRGDIINALQADSFVLCFTHSGCCCLLGIGGAALAHC